MKRIIYAGSELLTGDAIADALLDLSQALAESHAADNVEIPVVDTQGQRSTAALLVGPASQIVAVSSGSDLPELIDDEAVEEIRTRIRRLRPVITPRDEVPHDDMPWADEL